MPFVDLVSVDDYASIWYRTNTPANNVGAFDPAKPTILLLHPAGLDSSWMQTQVEDRRLSDEYNMIMLDTRVTGQSECKFSGKHDLWVCAADLAHVFYRLQLPPAHIFAPDIYTVAGVRFAALFPSLCLSLTVCSVPSPKDDPAAFQSLEELTQLCSFAEDLETFEYACKEWLTLFANPHAHADLLDDLVAFWETSYAPFRRVYAIAHTNVILNRTPLTPVELAAIRVPVLIIQSEQGSGRPLEHAERLAEGLVNVPNGALMFTVKAAAGYLNVVCASIINQVFAKFLSRQPKARSDLIPQETSLAEFMRDGLARLAQFRSDNSILDRDPCSPLSFSCAPQDVVKRQDECIVTYSKGMRHAFSPLGPDGRPIRKFSERQDHWLDAGQDGFSRSEYVARGPALDIKRPQRSRDGRTGYQRNGNGSPPTTSTTLVEDLPPPDAQVTRIRKANLVSHSTIDRQVVKGSMAKVVSATSSVPRLLR